MDLAALVKVVVALALIGAGASQALKAWRLRPAGVRALGMVVRHEHSLSEENVPLSAPVIAFVDEHGTEHRFTAGADTSWQMHAVGDRVPVRYPRERPDDARLNSARHNAFVLGTYGGMGAVFIVAGALVLRSAG
jgi:Protein of unknown function (DUF3592)